ncbi:MAG: hypothetical protein KJI72_01700 [Patescibacteria group bacterium]|nr:hypothetical protein [Patescibacteria group bacterium]
MITKLKKLVILAVIILIVFSLYFGAYLPFKKSTRFVAVTRSLASVRSVDILQRRFDDALNLYSPIAGDETISFFADQMLTILRTRPQEPIGRIVIEYATERIEPILSNPSSLELTKVLLKVGNLYQLGWELYGDEGYFERAEANYLRGLEISPRRPQFLYGLLQLYMAAGDKERIREVGEEISRYWPADGNVRKILDDL